MALDHQLSFLRVKTFYREPPLLAVRPGVEALADALCLLDGGAVEARVRPIAAATRRCSSGVNWKM